jgi:hypothetical protein
MKRDEEEEKKHNKDELWKKRDFGEIDEDYIQKTLNEFKMKVRCI